MKIVPFDESDPMDDYPLETVSVRHLPGGEASFS